MRIQKTQGRRLTQGRDGRTADAGAAPIGAWRGPTWTVLAFGMMLLAGACQSSSGGRSQADRPEAGRPSEAGSIARPADQPPVPGRTWQQGVTTRQASADIEGSGEGVGLGEGADGGDGAGGSGVPASAKESPEAPATLASAADEAWRPTWWVDEVRPAGDRLLAPGSAVGSDLRMAREAAVAQAMARASAALGAPPADFTAQTDVVRLPTGEYRVFALISAARGRSPGASD